MAAISSSTRPRVVANLRLTARASAPTTPRSISSGTRGAADTRWSGRCHGAANDALTKVKDEGNQGTAEQYSAAIAEMSAAGDWMCCVELMTETKLLGLPVEQEALEGVAAVLSGPEVDQGAKAATILVNHLKAGGSVTLETLCDVMRCLAAKPDCKSAAALMELAAPEPSQEYIEPLNCLLRAYARADEAEDANALFQKLFSSDLVLGDSYTALASMHLRAGDGDSADMMLELRG